MCKPNPYVIIARHHTTQPIPAPVLTGTKPLADQWASGQVRPRCALYKKVPQRVHGFVSPARKRMIGSKCQPATRNIIILNCLPSYQLCHEVCCLPRWTFQLRMGTRSIIGARSSGEAIIVGGQEQRENCKANPNSGPLGMRLWNSEVKPLSSLVQLDRRKRVLGVRHISRTRLITCFRKRSENCKTNPTAACEVRACLAQKRFHQQH